MVGDEDEGPDLGDEDLGDENSLKDAAIEAWLTEQEETYANYFC